jgi:hypothetical protein
MMGRERHRTDHDRVEMMSRQDGENFLRGPQKIIGLAHVGVFPDVGLSHEKRSPMVSAAAILSCTDRRLIRASSRSRDRIAHALRRGPRLVTAAVVFGSWAMGDTLFDCQGTRILLKKIPCPA